MHHQVHHHHHPPDRDLIEKHAGKVLLVNVVAVAAAFTSPVVFPVAGAVAGTGWLIRRLASK